MNYAGDATVSIFHTPVNTTRTIRMVESEEFDKSAESAGEMHPKIQPTKGKDFERVANYVKTTRGITFHIETGLLSTTSTSSQTQDLSSGLSMLPTIPMFPESAEDLLDPLQKMQQVNGGSEVLSLTL